MAKDEENKKQAKEKKESSGRSFSVIEIAVIALVVLVCSAAGFGLCSLLAGGKTDKDASSETDSAAQEVIEPENQSENPAQQQKTWFYDLDPVIANLDVPGATRYVRATLTLELSSELNQQKGTSLIDYKKPILINWLTIYLASLSLDDVRGERNLRRIQAQILEAFNEELFGSGKPMIVNVLIKEFPIQ